MTESNSRSLNESKACNSVEIIIPKIKSMALRRVECLFLKGDVMVYVPVHAQL